MSRLALLVLFLSTVAVFVAPSASVHAQEAALTMPDDLVDRWVIDIEPMLAETPEDQRAMMRSMLSEMQLSILFEEDGSFEMSAVIPGQEDELKQGTYRVDRIEGDAVFVTATVPDEDESDASLRIVRDGADRIELTDVDSPGGEVMHFLREGTEPESAVADGGLVGQPAAVDEDDGVPTYSGTVDASSLHGVWGLDVDATVAEAPAEQREMMAAMIGAMELTVTFGAGGEFSLSGSGGEGESDLKQGTYEILGVDGAVVTVSATVPEEDPPSNLLVITFTDEDRFQMAEEGAPPGVAAIAFVRTE